MNPTPKIPTLIGLLLLAVIIGSSIFIVERVTRTSTTASETLSPNNIQITNVTENSMTVSWTTNSETTGIVSLAPAIGVSKTAFDDRDTEKTLGKYVTHHVTVRDLTPDTGYTITILSGGKKFRNDANPWKMTTYPANSSRPNTLEPAYGTVVTPEGTPAKDTLVYVTIDGAQTLSTFTNTSGSWVIPLTLARMADGSVFVATADRISETIAARYGNQLATATSDTLNDSPVPEMTLGKTYDFRRQQGKKPGTGGTLGNLLNKTQSVLGSATSTKSATPQFTVTSPEEKSSLTSFLPLVEGTGFVGKMVSLAFSLPKQTGEASVTADGTWRFTPKTKLAPGPQVLTAKSQNDQGAELTLVRNFQILKSGTQVLGIATPSASLTPTPIRSTTPTPTVRASTTPASSVSATPTPQSVPVTGSSEWTLYLVLIGLGFVSTGAYFLRRQ